MSEFKVGDVVRWKNDANNVTGISKIITCEGSIDCYGSEYVGQTGYFVKIYDSCIGRYSTILVAEKNMIKVEPAKKESWSLIHPYSWSLNKCSFSLIQKYPEKLIVLIEEENYAKSLNIFENFTNTNSWIGTSDVNVSKLGKPNAWEYSSTTKSNSLLYIFQYLIQGLDLPEKFDLLEIVCHPNVLTIFKEKAHWEK